MPESAPFVGLSEREARARLQAEGPNELPSAKPKSILRIAAEVVREPMLALLLATGAIYLVLGDALEALALLGAIFLVVGITLYQEQKAERTIQALRDLSSPRALVIRDGTAKRIAGTEVVRGDLIVLAEGDRVPADAVVLSSSNLRVDESLLTGESLPVDKRATADSPPSAPKSDAEAVYSGTLLVGGNAVARVFAVGSNSALGKIGTALSSIETGRTSLEIEIRRAVRVLAVLGLSACATVAVLYGLNRGDWLRGALAGLTTAISLVPEEFPVVLTVFLALGAWRISQNRVLTRRFSAIESLGSATVLCVDKTGTLTLNRMAVAALHTAGRLDDVTGTATQPLTDDQRTLIAFAILASKPDPFDPMERAFVELGKKHGILSTGESRTLVREYPLTHQLLAVTNVWRDADAGHCTVAVKGAPETVMQLCGSNAPADSARALEAMAAKGLRVLGVARAAHVSDDLPDSPRDFRLEFLGLVGLADPVRPGVPDAVKECYAAGIRIVMLTGDHPTTALQIAAQIGLRRVYECVTGAELSKLDDAALNHRIEQVDVFARVVPEEKLRLVTALKARGEVVAMTGDGVNDAPALKSADIGIAMGSRGTDVAREAGALVLLDDDFGSIVKAVRVGRRIYDNIKKAVAYVVAVHVPIAGISLIPVFFGWPLVLLPLHVVFMEMLIDPACSVAFEMEPEEANVMARPPRHPRQHLFERALVIRSLLQGAAVLGILLVVLVRARATGLDERDVRTLTFTTMIVTNLSLIVTNRSLTRTLFAGWQARNPALAWLFSSAFVTLALVLFAPPIREVFELARPHAVDLLVCALSALVALLAMEVIKKLNLDGSRAAAVNVGDTEYSSR